MQGTNSDRSQGGPSKQDAVPHPPAESVSRNAKADPGNTTQNAAPRSEPSTTGIPSTYYEKQTGYGTLHITIVDRDGRPIRVFVNLPPLGTEISALSAVMGILLSKYLETGGDPLRIVKHLNSVKGDRPIGFGPHRVDSVAHAVGQCLQDHLRRRGLMNGDRQQPGLFDVHAESAERDLPARPDRRKTDSPEPMCPQCYSRNVQFVNGCKEPTCLDCGFSNCG